MLCSPFSNLIKRFHKDEKMKGFRVMTLDGRKLGVAASSLSDLIKKSCNRLKVPEEGVSVSLPDGTTVEDDCFFHTLSNQSCVLLLLPGEVADDRPAVLRMVVGLLKTWRKEQLVEGVRSLVKDVGMDLTSLSDAADQDKSALSSRQDDPEWFQNVDSHASTKEQYLRCRCAVRVRAYFYRSRRQSRPLCRSDSQRRVLDAVWHLVAEELRRNSAHAGYFDRGAAERMCDERGVFPCEGEAHSPTGCVTFRHRINPYASRQTRIEFSTWNLDHRIERSRSVLPALLTACGDSLLTPSAPPSSAPFADPHRSVNWLYFYRLLFTRHNLGLVHVVCHDKRAHHRLTCDPALFLTAPPPPSSPPLRQTPAVSASLHDAVGDSSQKAERRSGRKRAESAGSSKTLGVGSLEGRKAQRTGS